MVQILDMILATDPELEHIRRMLKSTLYSESQNFFYTLYSTW
jgi:hypothetical protein